MNEEMAQAEFGALMAYLAQNGITNQVARDVLGNDPAGRTRGEIADILRAWLRTRPKGS